jgi:hypothetical protein
MTPGPRDELRHPDAQVEEWLFTAWVAQPLLGVISGYRIVDRAAWYWAALAGTDRPLLHVADWHVRQRSDPLLVKSTGLWAEHSCVAPLEQWTIANETYAAALDDPDEALGRAYGVPTALSWDLEWYSTAAPQATTTEHYEQAGVVHGRIELGGAGPLHLDEAPAHRWHRWGDRLDVLELPEAFAHTGVRAPFGFPDGTVADWVITPDGWRARR